MSLACFLCKRAGAGSAVSQWGGIRICNTCRLSNHDGVVPMSYPHLKEHLESLGLEVKLNAKGWIDIPN